jgi:ferredoxin
MKIEVDFQLCESNAFCVRALPEVFQLDDDDYLQVLTDTVRRDQEAAAQQAARLCPRAAITITA